MDITTAAGITDNEETTQPDENQRLPEKNDTEVNTDDEGGKVSGESNNNGYGNTPHEEDDEPADPDLLKSDQIDE